MGKECLEREKKKLIPNVVRGFSSVLSHHHHHSTMMVVPATSIKVINSFEDGLWTIMRQAGPISNKSEAVQHSLERFLCMKVSTDMKRTTCFQKACIPSTHTYCPLIVLLRAQCVDTCHSLFEAVQEVFRQTVPVARQTLPVLKDSLHAEPGNWRVRWTRRDGKINWNGFQICMHSPN